MSRIWRGTWAGDNECLKARQWACDTVMRGVYWKQYDVDLWESVSGPLADILSRASDYLLTHDAYMEEVWPGDGGHTGTQREQQLLDELFDADAALDYAIEAVFGRRWGAGWREVEGPDSPRDWFSR